jgi:hypothetical protein
MTEAGKRTDSPFVGDARYVMEDTRSLSEVPSCELLLDHYVSGKEPIEGTVEFHLSASVSESSSARVVVVRASSWPAWMRGG